MADSDISSLRKLIHLENVAQTLAIQYHDGQLDAAGHPYLNHLAYVSVKANEYVLNNSDDQYSDETAALRIKCKIVGWLHDILEDTDCTVGVLQSNGFSLEIIDAIVAMTHKKDETYFDYVKRVSENEISRIVKLADLENNLDVRRLNEITEYVLIRIRKYWATYRYLTGQMNEETAKEIINKKKI